MVQELKPVFMRLEVLGESLTHLVPNRASARFRRRLGTVRQGTRWKAALHIAVVTGENRERRSTLSSTSDLCLGYPFA